MPIYEYRCGDCRRLTSVFFRSSSGERDVTCEKCGSTKTSRTLSRFAYHRSQADVLRDYGDPAAGDVGDYQDPRQIGRWAESKFEEYGMDLPDEARTMIDAAREGEFPDPVKDL
ncbi:MAG: zinc ribbon domain-containing protein [Dehalococcoidia bacterium]